MSRHFTVFLALVGAIGIDAIANPFFDVKNIAATVNVATNASVINVFAIALSKPPKMPIEQIELLSNNVNYMKYSTVQVYSAIKTTSPNFAVNHDSFHYFKNDYSQHSVYAFELWDESGDVDHYLGGVAQTVEQLATLSQSSIIALLDNKSDKVVGNLTFAWK